MLVSVSVDLNIQDVYIAKLVLEVLRTAKAHELSLHHDGQPGTEGLTFFHARGTKKIWLKRLPFRGKIQYFTTELGL